MADGMTGVPATSSLPGPAALRCTEMTRTDTSAWARCRRDDDGHQRHHVRGRAWSTGGNTPRLELGFTCAADGCCRWPQQEVPYLGAAAKGSAADGGHGRR